MSLIHVSYSVEIKFESSVQISLLIFILLFIHFKYKKNININLFVWNTLVKLNENILWLLVSSIFRSPESLRTNGWRGGGSEIHRPCPPWGLRDGGLKSSKLMQSLKYSSLLLASNSQTSGMIEISIVLSVKIVKFMDPPSGVRVLGLGSNNHFIMFGRDSIDYIVKYIDSM